MHNYASFPPRSPICDLINTHRIAGGIVRRSWWGVLIFAKRSRRTAAVRTMVNTNLSPHAVSGMRNPNQTLAANLSPNGNYSTGHYAKPI